MRVLVGCEFSGVVRRAFRALGHEAYSCDLIAPLDGLTQYHLQMDVFEAIEKYGPWDLGIFHPSCDRLLGAGALHWKKWQAAPGFEQQKAIVFFMRLMLARIPKVAIENPAGIMSSCWRKPDQIIHPWMFGHKEMKPTHIWLEGLPRLEATDNVYGEMMSLPRKERQRIHYESPGTKNGLTRSQRRAIFFPGIAAAMAEQWGQ